MDYIRHDIAEGWDKSALYSWTRHVRRPFCLGLSLMFVCACVFSVVCCEWITLASKSRENSRRYRNRRCFWQSVKAASSCLYAPRRLKSDCSLPPSLPPSFYLLILFLSLALSFCLVVFQSRGPLTLCISYCFGFCLSIYLCLSLHSLALVSVTLSPFLFLLFRRTRDRWLLLVLPPGIIDAALPITLRQMTDRRSSPTDLPRSTPARPFSFPFSCNKQFPTRCPFCLQWSHFFGNTFIQLSHASWHNQHFFY